MNKRNLVYLVLLLVLSAGAYFFVFKKGWSTLKADEKNFAVQDTGAIGKIMIADMNQHRVLYERKGGQWTGNDSVVVAGDYMDELLSTIRNLSVQSVLNELATDHVMKSMASTNKVVEIYDRSGQLLKRYYVGAPANSNRGTYMLMDGSEHPYVMGITGFEGVLDVRYETDLNKVRSLSVFHLPVIHIKELEIRYPQQDDRSFALEVLGKDQVRLSRPDGKNVKSMLLSGDQLAHAYDLLNGFRDINCEAFINDSKVKDTLFARQQPFCVIRVLDIAQTYHTLVLYHKPIDASSLSQYDANGVPLVYDLDRYFASIHNGKDFVLMQVPMVQPLLLTWKMMTGEEAIPPPPVKQLPVTQTRDKLKHHSH